MKTGILSVALMMILSGFAGVTAAEDVARVERRLLEEAAAGAEKHRKGDVELVFRDSRGAPLAGARVEIVQLRHEFLFGCIIFDLLRESQPFREETFKRRFSELFNFAVFPFYWAGYEPGQGRPEWEKLLPVLRWCRDNGITAKGHPVVWSAPSGRPGWLQGYPPETVETLLEARVLNVVGGFRDEIAIWDVVNEPVTARAWGSKDERVWFDEPLENVAPYVEKAFRWARKADPRAHLVLNDFYQIARPNTRERFYELVRMLLDRGTPISGLGIQAHEPRQEWYPPLEVVKTFDRLAELGLPLHITEFIPQSGGKPITGGWRVGTWDETTQADFAEQMFRLAFGHPAMRSINWWGFTDRNIWQKGGGLLDEEYRPKPVYERLKKLLHEEWHTSLDTKTDSDGRVALRAFHGDYRLVLRLADGAEKNWELKVRSDEENRWVFRVE